MRSTDPVIHRALGDTRKANEPARLVAEAAGQEHDPLLKLGPRSGRSKEERDAIEIKHPAVANDNVEVVAGVDSLERAEGRAANVEAEAPTPQHPRVRSRECRIVLDQEHQWLCKVSGGGAASRGGPPLPGCGGSRS
jgi:hypothetical protein